MWDPIKIGRMSLGHRLAMAPMTRSRAKPDGTPGDLAAEYYTQRAGLGLLISEGTQPSEDGQGYIATPGIYAPSHVAGWRAIADAVHGAGGHLVIQIMHVGRMSHPDNTLHHRQSLAPSALAAPGEMFTAQGPQAMPAPRAMTPDDITTTIGDFRHAAAQAIAAGADAVEIHGANGYLLQQFMAPNANQRDDAYGGSIQNRARFALEVAAAVADAIGPGRTGIHLSPGSHLGGLDEGPEGPALYRHLVRGLAELGLAYVHIAQGKDDALLAELRGLWPNALLVNRGNRPIAAIDADLKAGLADVAPVARWALANPDFVARLKQGAALNEADPGTFYGRGARGYTDYPRLSG